MDETLDQVCAYIDQHFDEHVAALQRYLRQPSISTQNVGIQECAEMTAAMLGELGAEARVVPLEGGHPVVYGHLPSHSSDRALLFYSMYDVQPPEPLEAWQSPPFEANIVGDRIVARGAFNTKGPLMGFLNAVRSLRAVTGDVPVNLIFVIEGEEELASRSLPQFLSKYAGELKKADAVYFHLATEMVRGVPQIVLGCKGAALIELEVKTLSTDAHSLTAPVVHSPVWRLIWALNSMRGADDRIVIDGFYENVRAPSAKDLELLANLHDAWGPAGLGALYGVTDFRQGLEGLDFVREMIFAPTLNINGFLAGHPEAGIKTIVPASAKCQVDIRLVPDMGVQEMVDKVRAHLDRYGYADVQLRLLGGYGPGRTSPEHASARAAIQSIRKLGQEPRILPMLPSTGPIIMFSEPPLSLPFVTSGLGHGWLMHAPNEYFEVEGLRASEKSAAAFLLEYAALED